MTLNRRGFLKSLAILASGIAARGIIPTWAPDEPLTIVTPDTDFSYLTISMITRETLRILENNLVFAAHVNRQYDTHFDERGLRIGTTIAIRKPNRYKAR